MTNNLIDNINVSESIDGSKSNFFLPSKVIPRKNQLLKVRLQTLIISKGLTESQFYHSLGIAKQNWYRISWGLWTPHLELKLKIAQALGTDSALIWQDVKNDS